MSAWTCRSSDAKADRLVLESHWKGGRADSEEKHVPARDIDTDQWIVKALDPNRPIREADISVRRIK